MLQFTPQPCDANLAAYASKPCSHKRFALLRIAHVAPHLPSPIRSDPNEYIQTLYAPFLLSQQPLDPLITLPFTRMPQANPPPDALDRRSHNRPRRMVRSLRQHTRRLRHGAIQRQLSAIRKRRIEPWRVKVEERDDEDEKEERAVYARSI
jgi:hypothetical protein